MSYKAIAFEGYDRTAPFPLEPHESVNSITERDAIPLGKRYPGIIVYCKVQKRNFILDCTDSEFTAANTLPLNNALWKFLYKEGDTVSVTGDVTQIKSPNGTILVEGQDLLGSGELAIPTIEDSSLAGFKFLIRTATGKFKTFLTGFYTALAGGTTGQVLTKVDNTDYNYIWSNLDNEITDVTTIVNRNAIPSIKRFFGKKVRVTNDPSPVNNGLWILSNPAMNLDIINSNNDVNDNVNWRRLFIPYSDNINTTNLVNSCTLPRNKIIGNISFNVNFGAREPGSPGPIVNYNKNVFITNFAGKINEQGDSEITITIDNTNTDLLTITSTISGTYDTIFYHIISFSRQICVET